MTPAAQSTPILPTPHRIAGTGTIRIRGAGDVVVELAGSGQVTLRNAGRASVHFEGRGARRRPSTDVLIVAVATGTLAIEGSDLDVEFSGGTAVVHAMGRFEIALDGRGEVEPPRGRKIGWGLHPRAVRIDGAALDAAPQNGAAA